MMNGRRHWVRARVTVTLAAVPECFSAQRRRRATSQSPSLSGARTTIRKAKETPTLLYKAYSPSKLDYDSMSTNDSSIVGGQAVAQPRVVSSLTPDPALLPGRLRVDVLVDEVEKMY